MNVTSRKSPYYIYIRLSVCMFVRPYENIELRIYVFLLNADQVRFTFWPRLFLPTLIVKGELEAFY